MHLFLSPHYDDAVLSCGGLIHKLVGEGKRVVVRTVMGGAPLPKDLPDTPIILALHERWEAGENPVEARIKEDEAAVTSLGASAEHMVYWMDCVYRLSRKGEALYSSEASLWADIHPDDVAGQLLPTLVFSPQDVIRGLYVPMGVGKHVDHRIVRNWALELRKQYPWVALNFYEEYPYIETAGAVDEALKYFAQLQPPLKLEAENVPLQEADVAAKIKAVGFYTSQIGSFWPDAAAMDTGLRAMLTQTGGGQAAERLWKIV
ncbi:MAG: PIG-L family deacetylase [Chloroflexota bacterium]